MNLSVRFDETYIDSDTKFSKNLMNDFQHDNDYLNQMKKSMKTNTSFDSHNFAIQLIEKLSLIHNSQQKYEDSNSKACNNSSFQQFISKDSGVEEPTTFTQNSFDVSAITNYNQQVENQKHEMKNQPDEYFRKINKLLPTFVKKTVNKCDVKSDMGVVQMDKNSVSVEYIATKSWCGFAGNIPANSCESSSKRVLEWLNNNESNYNSKLNVKPNIIPKNSFDSNPPGENIDNCANHGSTILNVQTSITSRKLPPESYFETKFTNQTENHAYSHIKIIYHPHWSDTPFLWSIPVQITGTITLHCFKSTVPHNQTKLRYFFKAYSKTLNSLVFEEITDDQSLLPICNGSIICRSIQ